MRVPALSGLNLSRLSMMLVVAAGLLLTWAVAVRWCVWARRALAVNESRSRLSPVLLAVYAYRDEYGVFPSAAGQVAGGAPLHSWRTLILPYMNPPVVSRASFQRYDLKEPWNSE